MNLRVGSDKAVSVGGRLRPSSCFRFRAKGRMFIMDVRSEDRVMIQKHWKDTAVFTDALYIEPWVWGEIGKKVPEGELLPGELSAVTFPAGCYTVRSAQRVYRIYGTGCFPEKETPASREETERVRKDVTPIGTIGPLVPAWRNELRVTHEISARHNDAPEGKFTYICRAAEASSGRWTEHISAIYSVKESKFIPDEYASLLVCLTFTGDSHGVDTWYKLDPTGKITTLRLHPYDSNVDKARFT